MTTPSNHSQPRGRALKKVLAAAGILLLGAVALFLLLGLVPGPSAGLDADPAPAAAYTEAIERYQPIELAEQGVASRAGSSRLMTHGAKTPRAYVMIHGITNSPLQWAELG